jgi:hypothetical protein
VLWARATSRSECSLRSAGGQMDRMDSMDGMDPEHEALQLMREAWVWRVRLLFTSSPPLLFLSLLLSPLSLLTPR